MRLDYLLFGTFASVFIIGLATGTAPLTFLAVALGSVTAIGRSWSRRGLLALTFERRTRDQFFMIGDTVDLEVDLRNPSLLPLPWVEISDGFPAEGVKAVDAQAGRLQIQTGLGWFQRLRRIYSLTLNQRGYYRFGPSTLRVWDPLGLTYTESRRARPEDSLYVTVYPHVIPWDELGISSDDPFGEPEQNRWLFPDPLSTMGARPYRLGDPINQIHWPATAAAGELMSRVLEGTRSPEVIVALNLSTMDLAWVGVIPELMELSITAAASLSSTALDQGLKVGLLSNGNMVKKTPDSPAPPLIVAPSTHHDQVQKILAALARASDRAREPLEKTLDRHLDDYRTASWVVITAVMTPTLRTRLSVMSDIPLTIIYTGDPPVPPMPTNASLEVLGGKERWRKIAGN